MLELTRPISNTACLTPLEQQANTQADDGTQSDNPERNPNATAGGCITHLDGPLDIERCHNFLPHTASQLDATLRCDSQECVRFRADDELVRLCSRLPPESCSERISRRRTGNEDIRRERQCLYKDNRRCVVLGRHQHYQLTVGW